MIKLPGTRQFAGGPCYGVERRYTESTGWKMPGEASSRQDGVFGSMEC
jgi:hypothetical protein